MMRGCGADYEIQSVADHHQPTFPGHPGVRKECRPSLQLAADGLRRAGWQRAVVCLPAAMKVESCFRPACHQTFEWYERTTPRFLPEHLLRLLRMIGRSSFFLPGTARGSGCKQEFACTRQNSQTNLGANCALTTNSFRSNDLKSLINSFQSVFRAKLDPHPPPGA